MCVTKQIQLELGHDSNLWPDIMVLFLPDFELIVNWVQQNIKWFTKLHIFLKLKKDIEN